MTSSEFRLASRCHFYLYLLGMMCVASFGAAGIAQAAAADVHTDGARRYSHRLIVELEDAPLALDPATRQLLREQRGAPLDWRQPAVASKAADLQTKQARALARLSAAVPGLRQSNMRTESGARRPLNYLLSFNGFCVETDPGIPLEHVRQQLASIPGVKAVHRDYAYTPAMFASLPQINAPAAWAQISGGITNAGRGIKAASMDGGVHHAAAMFAGDGFDYPPGYPAGGLGETNNNNGKIIVSRAYFRDWDPPLPGDEYAWPGPVGTGHGVHTAGTMAGNPVAARYMNSETYDISGVAPAAWIMSYRVFYGSQNYDHSFYAAEGIAALEDILADGADVLNNSWGSGPGLLDTFDPLGVAAVNVANAGTFVSFSAGNNGPERSTLDHANSSYITVASISTVSGGFSAGQLWVDAAGAPTNLPFSIAEFGPSWPTSPTTLTYAAAALIDPGNLLGCSSWPAGTFSGRCAVIKRGVCDFSTKVYEAQLAGATAAIIYNDEARGDALTMMGGGVFGGPVTIPSVFVGNSSGHALVNWLSNHPNASVTIYFGNGSLLAETPDVVASSSSRGPGTGNVLKPDIAAPGVNILSQGYGASGGEQAHLEFGAISGTSMAAPHIAGAGALLRQLYPDWSNADIKSALMNTARFLDIYLDNAKTQLAQPLDMGAGCVDLARAIDPGILLDPPSLSFGQITAGETPQIAVTIRSVGTNTETYTLSTLTTTGGPSAIIAWPALSFAPASFTLAPGASTVITATLHTASAAPGDLQGFLLFSGTVYQAHMPAWGAVAEPKNVDVLLLDFDASSETNGLADYLSYYTNTLTDLGWSYDVLDVSENYILPAVELHAYRALLFFTGDNGVNGASTLSSLEVNRLTDYINNGGVVIVMGQAAYHTIPSSAFRDWILGMNYPGPSVTGGSQPSALVGAVTNAPLIAQFNLDVGATGDGAHNQTDMNELYVVESMEFVNNNPFVPWLAYPPPAPDAPKLVAYVRRDQPAFNYPGPATLARAFVSSFGLEGINNENPLTLTRGALLERILAWASDEPVAQISVEELAPLQRRFTVSLNNTSGSVSRVRWSFGDSTNVLDGTATTVDHTFATNGAFLVQAHIINTFGNHAVASAQMDLFVSYEAWADALAIPAHQRGYADDPFGQGVPNLIAYATGISPQAPDRKALTIAFSNGSPFIAIPWRMDISPGASFRTEASGHLPDPAAWLAASQLIWQSSILGSNRVEWQGRQATNPVPSGTTYRVWFELDP